MKLSKIRLINWHQFNNNIITLNGNTVLTGENGNGKSTLIDAIYFVLSGGDASQFNTAANVGSERSVVSYVRGKTGSEKKNFLRNQQTIISHIALEFEDAVKRKKTLGCVIEVNGKNDKESFYILDKHGVDQIDFIKEDNTIVEYSDLLKMFNSDDFRGFNGSNASQKNVRSNIALLLGLNSSEKYHDLLKKAVAFKPLDNEITNFVNSFLLKEDNISLDNIKDGINAYRDVKDEITKYENQLRCLETFIHKGIEYNENAKYITYLNVISLKNDIIKSEVSLTKNKERLTHLKGLLDNIEIDKKSLEEKKDSLTKTIYDLENDDSYKAIKDKTNEYRESIEKLNKAKELREQYNDLLNNEQVVANELELDFNFPNFVKLKDIVSLNEEVQIYVCRIHEIQEQYREKIGSIKEHIATLQNKLNEDKQELNNLHVGLNTYDENLNTFHNVLIKNLSNKFNRKINCKLLCECFEIEDEEWANAIEGYLNAQRFYTIVDGIYYDSALEIYNEMADRYGIYNKGLVNTKIKTQYPVEENSLFTKISVTIPSAEPILRRILGRVICCDNVLELQNYEAAITKDCMRYKSLVASKIHPKVYSKHYIGLKSQKQRAEFLNKEINSLISKIKELEKNNNSYESICNSASKSRFHKDTYFTNAWKEVEILAEKADVLQNQLIDLKKNSDFAGLQESIDNYRNEIITINNQYKEKQIERDEMFSEISVLNDSIPTLETKLKEIKENYNFYIESNNLGEDYYNYETKVLNNKESNIRDLISDLDLKNKSYKKDIEAGMLEYYRTFERNLGVTIDDLDKYITRYNHILNVEIIGYREKAEAAYENAKYTFNTNFVDTLRGKIQQGQKYIQNINRILINHPFGHDREIYKFVYAASGDDDMARYYRILSSNKSYGQMNLLNERMSDEDEEAIKELFDRITNGTTADGNIDKDLEDFLDYRKYMSYDIKITSEVTSDVYLFSKIANEKSGGETQTPFYVIMAACFESLIKDEGYSSCLIIFDEAFNNMDEVRITTLLDYYQKLYNLQFIIGVPTNRVQYILPSIDTCIGLIKENNSISTFAVNKDEMLKD